METKGRRPSRNSEPGAAATEVPVLAQASPAATVTPAAAADPASQPATESAAPDAIGRFGREALAALAESQTAWVRGLAAIGDAVAGLTHAACDIATSSAIEMLGVKTTSDAVRVGTRFARKSIDGWLDGSARLSGLGVQVAAESSQSILARLGECWIDAFPDPRAAASSEAVAARSGPAAAIDSR